MDALSKLAIHTGIIINLLIPVSALAATSSLTVDDNLSTQLFSSEYQATPMSREQSIHSSFIIPNENQSSDLVFSYSVNEIEVNKNIVSLLLIGLLSGIKFRRRKFKLNYI